MELEADLATKSKILTESESNHKTSQAKLEEEITEQASRLKEIEEAFTQLKENPKVRWKARFPLNRILVS